MYIEILKKENTFALIARLAVIKHKLITIKEVNGKLKNEANTRLPTALYASVVSSLPFFKRQYINLFHLSFNSTRSSRINNLIPFLTDPVVYAGHHSVPESTGDNNGFQLACSKHNHQRRNCPNVMDTKKFKSL